VLVWVMVGISTAAAALSALALKLSFGLSAPRRRDLAGIAVALAVFSLVMVDSFATITTAARPKQEPVMSFNQVAAAIRGGKVNQIFVAASIPVRGTSGGEVAVLHLKQGWQIGEVPDGFQDELAALVVDKDVTIDTSAPGATNTMITNYTVGPSDPKPTISVLWGLAVAVSVTISCVTGWEDAKRRREMARLENEIERRIRESTSDFGGLA